MSKTSTVHSGVTFFRSALGVIAAAMMLTASFDASAQVVYNEGFDGSTALSALGTPSNVPYTTNFTTLWPAGWISGKYGAGVDTDNRWDRVKGSVNPTASPKLGTGMIRYLADYTNSGEAAFISSKRLDYQGWTSGNAATTSFWMYRDNGSALNDNVKVYLSNHPDPSLATSLILLNETGSGLNTINRPCASTPVVGTCGAATTYNAAAWYQYSYNLDLPAALGSFPSGSRDSVYIAIIGTSALGNNIYIDEFSVTYWPKLMTYDSAGLIFQNSATTAANNTNQLIVGGYISMSGESTPFSLANITFNWNGTTSPATDIQNAKLWYTGGTNSWDPSIAVQLGATIANPSLSSNMTWPGPFTLVHGDNYFWITYDIKTTAVSGNCVDAEFVSFDLQRTKTGSGTNGNSYLTVSDTTGLSAGMSVVGLAQTVSSFTGSTQVNLSAALSASSAGPFVFYVTQTPSPATLAGCRLIDFLYCVANMSAGTSWAGYTNNDYVSGVLLNGDNTPNNGIYTGRHWISYPTTCVNTGNYNINPPNAGDCAGSSTGCSRPWAQTSCPFTTHPPDYELMPQTTYRTTSMKADGSTNYTLQAWVGTWYGSNYLAAWMDLNKNGALDDQLMITTYSAIPGTGTQVIPTVNAGAGSTTLTLTAAWTGWTGSFVAGRPIWGPGIPAGATIVSGAPSLASPTSITISAPTTVALAGSPIYTGIAGGEKLFQSPGLANGGTFVCNFAIPTTSQSGLMRLRVREVYAVSTITSCGGWTWGETEDYIVTIIPPCNTTAYGAPPGYNKVWLGFTDDWDNPLNWCPTGVPTLSDNAFIPPFTGGTVAPYRPGNKHPLIKPNVNATSGRLRIADSLSVDAYTNSSLIVADSLVIQTNKVFRVTTEYKKDAQLLNGTLPLPTFYAPFRDGNKVRALIIMRPGDFAGQGVIPGDVIDTMLFYVQRQATSFTTNFTGVTIKYSLINPTTLLPGALGSVPPYVSGPWTIFSGNINATGAAANTWLTLTIPLIPGSFVYPSTASYLMFEICYDNNGAAGGGTLNFQHTQIVGSSLYGVVYGTPGASPCSMIPNDVANPATWYTNQYRPNITFRFRRPYIKYPIESRRNWINDGVFTAGISRVTMTGASAIGVPNTYAQAIGGTSQTTFFDLVINNTQHVTRQTNFTVTDTLSLLNGRLKLNGGTVTLTNPEIGGLYRTNGFLESETTGPLTYGDFRWNMTGTTLPSTRTIPFINTAGTYIPLTYNMTAGSHDVTFATYATPANNSPLPNHTAGPPGPVVNNINGYATGADNSMNMIDRYWKVYNATPSGATVDLTMTWAASENTSGAGTYLGQRWLDNAGSITPGPGWEYPFLAGQTPAATSITLPGFNLFSTNIWWAAVKDVSPLPVDLLNFTAKPVGSQVRLNWSTAAEFNNEKFIIERTVNMNDWSFIDELPSRGNSVVTQYYETWDENPVNGLQYYTLRQFDIGGKLTTYGPVAVDMTRKMFGIVSASVQSSANGITLIFNYDSNEPYSVEVVDMLGRVVGASSNNPGNPGMNVMDIKADLSSGIYQVILRNSSQVDTKKIFY